MLGLIISLMLAAPPTGTYLGLRTYSLSTLPSYYSILLSSGKMRWGIGLEVGYEKGKTTSWDYESSTFREELETSDFLFSPSLDIFFLFGEKDLYKGKVYARFLTGLGFFIRYDKLENDLDEWQVVYPNDTVINSQRDVYKAFSVGGVIRTGVEFQIKTRLFVQLRGDLISLSYGKHKYDGYSDSQHVSSYEYTRTQFRGINLFYSTFSTWVYIRL